MLILTAVGSVIFGLGVILIIAYNWEKMGRYMKLAIVFTSMMGAHAAGFRLTREGGSHNGMGEGLHLLGTMLFGAGIWLIAQTYHIDEHYPNGLLAWGMGAWAMAWAMPSIAQCILALLIFSFWAGFEALDFRNMFHFAPLLVLACSFPLAWVKRSRVLLVAGLSAFMAVLLCNFSGMRGEMVVPLVLLASAVIIMTGHLLESSENFSESSGIFSVMGLIPYVLVLYLLSFENLGSRLLRMDGDESITYFVVFSLAAGIVTALALAVRYLKSGRLSAALVADAAGIFTAMGVFVWKWSEAVKVAAREARVAAMNAAGMPGQSIPEIARLEGWSLAAIFNLILLSYCIMLIWDGVRKVNVKKTSLGVMVFALLAFTRYADLFDDLIVRGLVFLGVGGAIFAVGAFYNRFKKAKEV